MGLRFQFFGATAAQWTANNPVLLAREMGLETDTQKFKIGDGVTPWNSLPYGGIQGPAGPAGPNLTFSNSNGVTFGINASTLTASVQTNYQSAGAYLTTAALSQDSSKYAGTSTGITGGSVTLNTSGIAINLPAYLTTAALSGDTSKYAGVGETVGTTAGTDLALTVNTDGVSIAYPKWITTAQAPGAYLTTAALSADSSKYAGTSTGITGGSVTLNTSGIAINLPAYLTTADLSANSSNYVAAWDILGANTSGTTSSAQGTKLHFSAANSMTLSGSSNTIIFSVGAYLTTAALSGDTSKYAGINSGATNCSVTVNTSGVSVNLPAYLTTAALSGDTSKYAGINSGATNCSVTVNTSGVSVNLPAYLTTADLSANSSTYFQKWSLLGNSSGTSTTQSLSILQLSGGQGITLSGNSNTIVFSVGSYITTGALSGDTSKYAGINSGATNCSVTVNTSGVSVNLPAYLTTAALSADSSKYAGTSTGITGGSVTLNTSGIAINLPAYITTAALSGDTSKYAGVNSGATNCSVTDNTSGVSVNVPFFTISSYENLQGLAGGTQTMTFNGVSVSHAVAFLMPRPGSFSFLRIPVLMTTNSTTVASQAALSTGGGFVYSTWNAVAYSMNVGASSQSLASFAKGGMSATLSNSFSFNTANSGWSVSQGFTFNVGGGQTSVSSQYSATSASLNVSTNYLTNNSSLRFIDLNFANSLSAGNYWMVIGYNSSSTTSGQSGGPLTNAGVSYSNHYGVSQIASWFEAMNNTAGSSGGYLGAGSFSTNAIATTASLGLSNISSSLSNNRIYFQLLRSA